MGLKDILVHVDDSKSTGVRMELAANLAVAYEAHLSAIYALHTMRLPPYLTTEVGPDLYELHRKAAQAAADKAKGVFQKATDKAGLTAEWRIVEGEIGEVLVMHARHADLAILGQADPETETFGDLPERVILSAGRPVLVVPYAGEFPTVGERVLVAWNASREAARAVNDALPILKRAKQVTVMAVNPEGGNEGHGDIPGADISLHLARHGVKAEASQIFAADVDVGNMLLSRAADASADLIVMGAYGRSRLRELVMGGASRVILRHMTVPVLMSH